MSRSSVTLNDKYDLSKTRVLMNGSQALVRLLLMQSERDRANGLNTAGYVSGYRGSPLGALDMQMHGAKTYLQERSIIFEPGINEDIAATAIWGTQQAELRGEGKHDGVFSLWYGKGPGVDRAGDVLRHANLAGTSPTGGVLMAMGDDHTGESSTTCHQSDFAAMDAYIPVLSPAGVQEILDYGLYGFALSRFAGVWSGLKLMKDTVEVTSVVDASVNRMQFVTPEFEMPDGGLNIRLNDHWVQQEVRIAHYKRFAAEAFARANKFDRRFWGRSGAKIGFTAAGKNWLDLEHALGLLGIDAVEAERLGVTTYKIGQTFPLDVASFQEWADGLDLIVVIEEKRKLIEVQVKEAIFDNPQGRRVYGWHKGGVGLRHGEELFPVSQTLDPSFIAERIGAILQEEGRGTEAMSGALRRLAEMRLPESQTDIATRQAYFCSGCPHNSSTKVPEGSRAYAGIGCHIMALWMDRETSGYTNMGTEGANWIGEARYSSRQHVFQNMGDGTYNHSGLMAVRAAVSSGVNMTYKILYNDAVAMTGGQINDGDLPPEKVAHEMRAMGVKRIAIVFDEKEEPRRADYPSDVDWHPRSELGEVQERYRQIEGASGIIFIQTCAAEKRRRRRRGEFPDPDKRVFINTDICEGCGDCGIQSNCVSIVPVETEFGRKRAIDQSSCNKDFSCLSGFCPAFVTVEGGVLQKEPTSEIDIGDLTDPKLPAISGSHNFVITGIGGTGVITIGAIISMAAHLEGKGAGLMEMAGIAQKGGAVHIHCRIGNSPEDVGAIRVSSGECDTLLGGDLVVSAGRETLALTVSDRTLAVVNNHETMTGDFTRDTMFRIPGEDLKSRIRSRLDGSASFLDATALAQKALGDAIYSNMILFGAAWQMGRVPLEQNSIENAIELNGKSVEDNKRAFHIGRWAIGNAQATDDLLRGGGSGQSSSSVDAISHRAAHLIEYQSQGLAKQYREFVDQFDDPTFRLAVAKGYHKVLAYKDEYEVARLLSGTKAKASDEFSGNLRLKYHLSPPFLSGTGPDGRTKKRAFGDRMEVLWHMLARLKSVRGTAFDPFGYAKERRMERALIDQYENDMKWVLKAGRGGNQAAVALAELPLQIAGFGPVKAENARKAALRRDKLLDELEAAGRESAVGETQEAI